MKWSIYWLPLALGVVACVDTTLDTPTNHPANPSAYPAAPAQPPPALSSGFDPFAAYASEATPAGAASEHDHSHAEQPSTAPAASSNAPSAAEPASSHAAHGGAHAGHDAAPTTSAAPPAAPHASHDHATQAPPKAASTQAPADDVVVYTCPMHPEIIRNAPGNCPICGMKLVPKKSPKPSNP